MKDHGHVAVALSLMLIGAGLLPPPATSAAEAEQATWQELFDGKSLDGWEQLGGKAKYSIEDGAIVGETVPKTPNSFLATKKRYGDLILEYEYQCDNELNSGVQIRSNAYDKPTLLAFGTKTITVPAERIHGYQIEIDPNKPERRWTGGIYEEGRRGWLYPLEGNPDAQAAAKPGEWNKVRVECIGDSIKTFINGVACADLVDSVTLEGIIALQVHGIGNEPGGPFHVRWRKLRIQDLGRRAWKPLFNGKDTTGWHATGGGMWQVKDAMIVGTSEANEKRHGLLVTNDTFKDFTARCKFRVTRGDSGFYFRAEEKKDAVGVHGFQVEVDESFETGGLYETGGRAWVVQPDPKANKDVYKPHEWNELTVSAHGGRIVVHINNQKTAELRDDPGRKEGHIALQLHGGQAMDVQYKDIEILGPAQ